MKSTSFLLIVAAALGLPELSWACSDVFPLQEARCECNYGDTTRCAIPGVRHGAGWACKCSDCPRSYQGHFLGDVSAISKSAYSYRRKCRDN
ncbi:hypothetical protein Vi05172_g3979 [Venturia inaequalis]|nr:hypothetical protein Vi05172_g3979 [Venturia inaequalis]